MKVRIFVKNEWKLVEKREENEKLESKKMKVRIFVESLKENES
jgi:hypothetical protein